MTTVKNIGKKGWKTNSILEKIIYIIVGGDGDGGRGSGGGSIPRKKVRFIVFTLIVVWFIGSNILDRINNYNIDVNGPQILPANESMLKALKRQQQGQQQQQYTTHSNNNANNNLKELEQESVVTAFTTNDKKSIDNNNLFISSQDKQPLLRISSKLSTIKDLVMPNDTTITTSTTTTTTTPEQIYHSSEYSDLNTKNSQQFVIINEKKHEYDQKIPLQQHHKHPFVVNVSKFDQVMGPKWKAPIVIEKYKLIFFTIQKVGCTVWKQLFRKMSGYSDWRTGNTFALRLSGLQSLRNFTVDEATHMMNSPEWTRAIMVREPKDRFVSAYLDKAVQTNYVEKFCCRNKFHKKRNGDDQSSSSSSSSSQLSNCLEQAKTFIGFFNITEWCNDGHWLPQSKRTESKYFHLLDFVGHLETAATDAERLLRHIGAWEEHGATGWGKYGNESIFQSTSNVKHKTVNSNDLLETQQQQQQRQKSRLAKYFTPELEIQFEERFSGDYKIPQFNFTLIRIHGTSS